MPRLLREVIGLIGVAVIWSLAAASVGAAEIQMGGTSEVKANSIWFQDAAKLTQWQKLKKGGNAKALSSYERKALSARDAWQFGNRHTVKIIGYAPSSHQVKVEMATPGRLLGSSWYLDDAVLEQ